MMSEELRACPFCGGEGHIRNRKYEWISVGCKNKNCIMWMSEENTGTRTLSHYTFISEASAIKAWNTRTPDYQHQAQQLAEALNYLAYDRVPHGQTIIEICSEAAEIRVTKALSQYKQFKDGE